MLRTKKTNYGGCLTSQLTPRAAAPAFSAPSAESALPGALPSASASASTSGSAAASADTLEGLEALLQLAAALGVLASGLVLHQLAKGGLDYGGGRVARN